ncbi:glycoside hydrolase family 18 protein [Hydnum rufescens UP504]|uniref:chitinase n=1 Tax=Hydnum rufescens UP504 TaxID=1448309 RepID=A0A9P6E1J9_9AGAM|nr:glycoside hydrolase family 18 protein [Hydnum rufescens UP504]
MVLDLFSIILVAFASILFDTAHATEAMRRPLDFKSKLKPNGAFHSNHTLFGRGVLLEDRTSQMKSIGYFTNWGVYGRNFQPSDIPTDRLTHILYAFADVNPFTGVVTLTDTYADQTKHYPGDSWDDVGNNLYGCFKQLYLLKLKNRSLKVLISVGGYTYSQSGHFNFLSNTTSRTAFVSSAIGLLEDNGLDGIDLDFEYPTATQASDFVSLLSELRAGLDAYASWKGDTTPYEISAAVPAGSANYQNLLIADMDKILTSWNLMAYDYAGSWSNISDDQANLYRGNTGQGVDTDATIKYYRANGATPSKIIMGIPIYGRVFESTSGIQQSFSGAGLGTWTPGVYDYKALPFPGAIVVEDPATGSSYSYDAIKQELVSYDTPAIVKQKAQYISDQGLGGSMYWELSADKNGTDSVIATATGVFVGLDTTPNHLFYPGSQFANIINCMGTC